MTTQLRFIFIAVLSAALVLPTGCGRSFSVLEPSVTLATEATIVSTIQYLDGLKDGPVYEFSLTLPESLVGKIATRAQGNVVYFDYAESNAPLFSIQALSRAQFWKQGNYPGEYTNIATTKDTYFVYHLPIDAFYSGLPKETFQAITAEIPGAFKTFTVKAAQ